MLKGLHSSSWPALALGLLLGFLVCLALTPPAFAQPVEIEGMASVPYSSGVFSSHPDNKTRQLAVIAAEDDALNRYAASFSASKFKMFQKSEMEITSHIQDFMAQPIIVDEGYKKDEEKYFVVIRATINTNALDAKLSGSYNSGIRSVPQQKLSISFLFVARTTAAVRQFDNRVTGVEVDTNEKKARQSEGLSGGEAKYLSSDSTTSSNTVGGSTLRQADQLTYAVSSPEDMNATMSQVFSDGGFNVYDYADVSSQCGGTRPEAVYKAFSTSDILPREIRKSTFDAAKKCAVTTFATGTLDIGLQDTDPVSGQKRVYVSVRAQVNDLSGLLPRLIASVGPVQYSGLGPDQQVAMRNALIKAATEAATEISNQLKSKGMN